VTVSLYCVVFVASLIKAISGDVADAYMSRGHAMIGRHATDGKNGVPSA
jgi:hypothetical protein